MYWGGDLGGEIGWGGGEGPGGHCFFEGRCPKQNYRPRVCATTALSHMPLLVYSPLF